MTSNLDYRQHMCIKVQRQGLQRPYDRSRAVQNRKSDSLHGDILGLIKMMLASVHVDDCWYRRRYPDVSAAVDAGEHQSTRHHFIEHGYFEGRLPCRLSIDEAWYIQTNDDVLAGIRNGEIESAEEHFNQYGYVEGRLPISRNRVTGRASDVPRADLCP